MEKLKKILDKKTKEAFDIILQKNLTLSCAESCTGGLLSSLFIEIPGSSRIFDRGFIVYSNQAKIDMLEVKKETIDKFGAVSKEVALEMSLGAIKNSKSDIAISVTGIAGPDGGSIEKPVGLVYIAIFYNGENIVQKFNFSGDRSFIRSSSALAALEILINQINL